MSSFAFPYIKTEASQVSTTKDVSTYPVPEGFVQGQGSIYCEFECDGISGDGFPYVIDLSDGTTSNVLSFLIRGVTGLGRFECKNGGAQVVAIDTLSTVTPNTKHKILLSYEDNNCKLFYDGVLQGTDNVVTIPTNLSTLNIGCRASNINQLNGTIKNFKYYNTTTSDATGVKLTTL